MEENRIFLVCPHCGRKTKVTVIPGTTEIRNLPLFCPKCHKESIINYT